MKYEHIKEYKDEAFRAVTGVLPSTFNAMQKVLKIAYRDLHKRKRGRHRALSVEDMLLMTLEYYKEYRTMDCIGASYGLAKSNVSNVIHWVEKTIAQSGLVSLPGKKKLTQPNTGIEVIVVDSTETPIERPKNRQKKHYSGKKNDIQ